MLTVLHGHVLTKLQEMASESVHCFVTSPPYWGLRDYQIPAQIWGGDEKCEHKWGEWQESHSEREANVAVKTRTTDRSYGGDESRKFNGNHQKHTSGSFCQKCEAWLGHLGLEPNPELYVRNLVMVLREALRVLRKDGVLWLNLGDSHAGSGRGMNGDGSPGKIDSKKQQANRGANLDLHDKIVNAGVMGRDWVKPPPGLKCKDLIGIPWMVAFALRADGWWLRSRIPWIKRNCMPESTTDRPSTAIEDVFLLSKSERYFYDGEAVKMPYSLATLPEIGEQYNGVSSDLYEEALAQNPSDSKRRIIESLEFNGGRSRRNSDWFMESWQGMLSDENGDPLALVVNTSPYKEAHFATFPPRLVKPMIMAGTSARGCCSKCGAPWARIIDKEVSFESGSGRAGNLPTGKNGSALQGGGETLDVRRGPVTHTKTTGWQPTCKCADPKVIPCTVCDPFGGSGTTGEVALELGRRVVLIELSEKYLPLIERRCDVTPGLALA